MDRVERVWLRRLRWRLRGAWQWPAFAGMALLDGIVLTRLPFFGEGTTLFAGVLVAGFLNLFAVAVLAPAAGALLRRRRPDLPRIVARDYAGTGLLLACSVLLVAGGLLHRPAIAAEEEDRGALARVVHDYVLASGDTQYHAGVGSIDALRIEPDLYRACVPGDDPRRWLCLIVSTDTRPAGIVSRDPDEAPNAAYRVHGAFR